MANSISYGPVLQGTSVAGQSGAVFPQLPARVAGDFIQVIIFGGAAGFPQTTDPTSYTKTVDVVSLGRVYQKGVVSAGAAGGTIEVRFETGSQPYAVVCAIVHADSSSSREQLVAGVDKPSATTAGVPGDAALTVTTTHTPASNTTYTNLDIRNDVNLTGKTGVTYVNCFFRGGLNSTAQGLVLAQGIHGRGHQFTDCTFAPQSPNFNKDGIRGYGFTLLRCDVSGVVDGVSVFCTQSPSANVDVTVQQTWIHDQAYWPNPPDTNHADGSHCDGIQWQGSPGLVVRGCLIKGVLDPAYQPGQFGTKHTNSCMMIKPDAGPISGATIVDNWFYGGNISVNSNDDDPDRFITNFGTFTGNRFDHDQRAQGGGGNDTWTFLRPVGASGTFTGNTYEDNGAAIRVRTQ